MRGLYRLSIDARIDELAARGFLSGDDADLLRSGRHVLPVRAADRMIENVIATFGLPLAVAPNFRVDDRDYVVPLVVEEPSIVAALSNAAQLVRRAGGFVTDADESLGIGQIHLVDIRDVGAAAAAIGEQRSKLVDEANAVHPRLVARGGGVRDIECHEIVLDGQRNALAVHLIVDTCDAMGANLINTLCEAMAPRVAELAGGNVAMRILSNLSDRALVRARAGVRTADLADDSSAAQRIRDRIVLASDIAAADRYRATTHNKGVMNGIDALAIATGNDWRAVEAGAHAYAAASGRYTSLTQWTATADGDLQGRIELPLKVGIVGGTLDNNQAAKIGLRVAGVASAAELAKLMAAVGLAQNLAALRALASTGIQAGHMRLHARAIAAAAGVPDDLQEDVVSAMLASGEIKDWKAREILAQRAAGGQRAAAGGSLAAGKLILFGEHAAVYGRHALALPIPGAVTASAVRNGDGRVRVAAWQIDERLDADTPVARAVQRIVAELDVDAQGVGLTVHSLLPPGMGLGSSAAVAVAVTRALAALFDISLGDDEVNRIAFECEKLAHGTPSGVDNTIATFATPLLFCRDEKPPMQPIELAATPPLVVAWGQQRGSTFDQVAAVRRRHAVDPARYDAIFDQIDTLALAGADALAAQRYDELGRLMDLCHGLLNAIGVSTPELESMLACARDAGAAGAKLTGAGGGGSIVAVCPGREVQVAAALEQAGFMTISLRDARAAHNE